jgi:tetratricopeptide (TPR) repeat protein
MDVKKLIASVGALLIAFTITASSLAVATEESGKSDATPPIFEALMVAELAYTCSQEGDFVGAIELYRRALPVIKAVSGPNSKLYSDMLDELSGCYLSSGQLEMAETTGEESLRAADACSYMPDFDYAVTCNNLAFIKHQLKKYDDSDSLYRAAMARLDRRQPLHRLLIAFIEINLGDALLERQLSKEAIRCYKSAAKVIERETYKDYPAVQEVRKRISRARSKSSMASKDAI